MGGSQSNRSYSGDNRRSGAERKNTRTSKEATRLKAQLKSHEGDRELLVRQMLTLKKENARLKRSLERPASAGVGGGASASPTDPLNATAPGKLGGEEGLKLSLDAADEELTTGQRLKEMTARQVDAEARYREVVARLKRLLGTERRNLRSVRQAHAKELESRTELEGLLRACVDDVRKDISSQRAAPPEAARGGMAASDRERVLELLLSQERVVTLLYDRTFPERPADATAGLPDLPEPEEDDPQMPSPLS